MSYNCNERAKEDTSQIEFSVDDQFNRQSVISCETINGRKTARPRWHLTVVIHPFMNIVTRRPNCAVHANALGKWQNFN